MLPKCFERSIGEKSEKHFDKISGTIRRLSYSSSFATRMLEQCDCIASRTSLMMKIKQFEEKCLVKNQRSILAKLAERSEGFSAERSTKVLRRRKNKDRFDHEALPVLFELVSA